MNDSESTKLELLFPDATRIFSQNIKSMNDVKDSCIVVLDTNILLMPFTVNSSSLDEIELVYKKLHDEKRLFIPAQVAREFAKNRPNKIMELFQKLNDDKSKITKLKPVSYPFLDKSPGYQEIIAASKEINEKISDYQKKVSQLTDAIKSWDWNDPVSSVYQKIFQEDNIIELKISKEEFNKDLNYRNENMIPPGYKDKGKVEKKEENQEKEDTVGNIEGDLLIWHTILQLGKELNQDCVFVTNDSKSDWWHKSSSQEIYPRFELVSEYFNTTGGNTLRMVKFSNFLSAYSSNKEVVKTVELQEVYEAEEKIFPIFCENCLKDLSEDWTGSIMVNSKESENNFFSNYFVQCKDCTRIHRPERIFKDLAELSWFKDPKYAQIFLEYLLREDRVSQNFYANFHNQFVSKNDIMYPL